MLIITLPGDEGSFRERDGCGLRVVVGRPVSDGGEDSALAPRVLRTPRRRGPLERRGAVVLLGLFAAGWLVFIFAGALARTNDLDARLTDARAQTAALEAQVEAGYAEIEFIKTDAYLEQAARGLGLGEQGEQSFALPDDAPPAQPIPLLGSPASDGLTSTPLEAWLELLFGSE